ncbi:hypothetical protein VTO42DRAFT_5746 [Malbranchea cinnamomea]
MTETSLIPTTHSAANLPPVATSNAASPVPNGTQVHYEDDEEPYTIKCICAFEDDDGSTVFCERCETWQHIICYYHDQEVPDIHNCADCEPRYLDAKRATERQRRLREQDESGDRKSKRAGSKGQKKKVKDTTSEQTNGWGHKELAPPAKKPRHRASTSVSSLTGTADGRKRTSSNTTVPSTHHKRSSSISSHHPYIPLYSNEFIHLYDNDHVNIDMESNLIDTIGLAGDLASWVQDPAALARVANGRSPEDVFTHSDQPLDPSKWPVLTKHTLTDNSVEYDGRHPTWKCLRVETGVRKDEIVGEVKGKVGHFRDYCLDPSSRWQELRHPEPFVFFHPQLPIYIDSRKEGTQLRYIRRSCRPNVTMKTFITNKVEYHFCFVANQDIPKDTEVTTTWYLDPQIFPSNGKLVKQEGSDDGIPDAAAISISNVLAHFGGCACSSSQQQPCLLAKVDLRRPPPKPSDSNSKQANGKRKKSKAKTTASPVSTGQAANSRAGSEAAKNLDEEDIAENRSTSGSARGNPRSRDLTPTGLIDGELSAREKRKIAAVEKKFEQLEQDQQHAQKRRKRNASQSQSLAGVNSSKSTTASMPKTPLLDTTISRRSSSSPTKMSPKVTSSRNNPRAKTSASNTPRVSSPLGRPLYVDTSVQTEPDESDPQYVPPKPVRRPGFIPLTQRLLKRCHEDRLRLEELSRVNSSAGSQAVLNGTGSMTQLLSPQRRQEDVEMKDADNATTPPKPLPTSSSDKSPSSPTGSTDQRPLHSLPSTVAHSISVPRKPSDGLSLQLPPLPFSQSNHASKMSVPSVQNNPIYKSQDMHPPSSNITAPSPVKKKITLNDYMSRRGSLMTPTKEKSQPQLPPVNQTPSSSADGSSSPSFSQASKSAESVKPESPTTPDTVMKDVQMSSVPNDASPSLTRDPRLQSR